MSCFNQLPDPHGYCPSCGYRQSAAPPHQLRPCTILYGKYLTGKALGEGGFGITYMGLDLNLHIKTAIKEYYPLGFVTRNNNISNTLIPNEGSHGKYFLEGRDKFINEAKSLGKFHAMPGIVSVKDFFLENGTAYIVMEYIEGRTMDKFLTERGERIPAQQVFDMMLPIVDILAEVHTHGIIHRDISPNNIMVTQNGELKLIDFGAARDFAESGKKSISIMLKPGFSPEEQYRSRGVQGPWTDIYALCATMYRAITGITPAESTGRIQGDSLKPPSALGISITAAQEAALMKGMAVFQANRFQNMSELGAAFRGNMISISQIPVLQTQTTTVSTPVGIFTRIWNFIKSIFSAPPPPVSSISSANLFCTRGNYSGATFQIAGTLAIGRDPNRCQILFPQDTRGISSLHCEVSLLPQGVMLTDKNSSYGTFVGGRRLAPCESVLLNSGDKFYIADGSNEFQLI